MTATRFPFYSNPFPNNVSGSHDRKHNQGCYRQLNCRGTAGEYKRKSTNSKHPLTTTSNGILLLLSVCGSHCKGLSTLFNPLKVNSFCDRQRNSAKDLEPSEGFCKARDWVQCILVSRRRSRVGDVDEIRFRRSKKKKKKKVKF